MSEGAGELFTVESILEHRKRRGKNEFYIKWLGYDHTHNSWEPQANIVDPALIEAFFVREKRRREEMKVRKEQQKAAATAATGESSGAGETSSPTSAAKSSSRAPPTPRSAPKARGAVARGRGKAAASGAARGAPKRLAGGDIRPDSDSDEDHAAVKKAKEPEAPEAPEEPEDEAPEEMDDEEEEVVVPKKKKVVEPEAPEDEEEAEEEELMPEEEELLPEAADVAARPESPEIREMVEVKNNDSGIVEVPAEPEAAPAAVEEEDASEVDNAAGPADSPEVMVIENGGAPPAPLPSNEDEPIVLGDDE